MMMNKKKRKIIKDVSCCQPTPSTQKPSCTGLLVRPPCSQPGALSQRQDCILGEEMTSLPYYVTVQHSCRRESRLLVRLAGGVLTAHVQSPYNPGLKGAEEAHVEDQPTPHREHHDGSGLGQGELQKGRPVSGTECGQSCRGQRRHSPK